jgi:hypothetical protein
MLHRQIHLSSFLFLLSSFLGCVVPLSPEWSDPQVNYPPTISSATPAIGSVFNMKDGTSNDVEVVLTDQNTEDKLYLRWLVDYPPVMEGVKHLVHEEIKPPESKIERSVSRFAPNCIDDLITRSLPIHRLLLAVSDRQFSDDDSSRPDKVPDGNFLLEESWLFDSDCQ